MRDYLKGKKVALVGPARSIEGSNNGSFIDSHDVVVRINYAKIGNSKDSGTKTTIIYYDGSFHDYGNLKPEYLVCSYPPTEWFFNERCLQSVNYYSSKHKHKIVDSDLYNKLKMDLNENNKSRPNTGLVALVDLLQYDIKSLFMTGIDFYRTSYAREHPDYGNSSLGEVSEIFTAGDNGDSHNIDEQFEYFKNNIVTDPRLVVDNFLKGFLE
jgi:hypothetical protein